MPRAVVRHLENRVTETAAAAHFAVSYGEQAYLILALRPPRRRA